MTIGFVKAHACGNDFLILDEAVAQKNHAALARRLCARNTSVGADGVEFVDRRENGEIFLRLFNADGSEAELSGNGTRCVAAWLARSEALSSVAFITHAGTRSCVLRENRDPFFVIETGMGVPRVIERALDLAGVGHIPGAMVNTGNPHFVLFVETEDFSAHGVPWQILGERISTDPILAHGTNVEFVRVISPDEIALRIYERGCGPTTSSGTGTSAASAAAMVLQGAAQELNAIAEGGPQRVVWPSREEELLLTGPAEIVCEGEIFGAGLDEGI